MRSFLALAGYCSQWGEAVTRTSPERLAEEGVAVQPAWLAESSLEAEVGQAGLEEPVVALAAEAAERVHRGRKAPVEQAG
jgi:hypothetical protein